MTKARNGWDAWYDQWDERYVDEPGDDSHPIPYEHLTFWGERFQQVVMLNDHWIGYMQPEPMSVEDAMSIAFVLYDAGVDVDDLILLLDEFEPLEGSIARVGVPLCWLTDPMDHVQDLLSTLEELPQLDRDTQQQMQQTLEETRLCHLSPTLAENNRLCPYVRKNSTPPDRLRRNLSS